MAYDRYEARRDRWRDADREDDRGFFEKAGDEIASWFGSDDERRRRDEDMLGRERGWARDRDWDRNRNHDWDNDRGRWSDEQRGYQPTNWTSSNREYGRGFDNEDRGYDDRGRFAGSGRDYGRGSYGYAGGSSYGYGRGDHDRSETAWGRDDYRNTSFAGSTRDNDRHYGAWRQRQLNDLDRDYAMYCRERQDWFENDFGTWRNERQMKRQHLGGIQEHMDVVGSDGETVGKVDCVKGDRIVLTKSDSEDNRHHSFDCSLIETVEGNQVRLQVPAEEAKSRFDQDDRGFFGRGPDHEGPNLERSFSGTYTR